MPATPPLFAFEDVVLHGDGAPRLDHLRLEIPDDGVTVVVGPSGSGKSSLLRLCNRLEVADRGVVRFRGQDVDALDPLLLRRTAGMVLQRPVPFAGTVRDNLLVARPADASDVSLAASLERTGLDPAMLGRVADELSGGELQRMCIARTLLTEPEVLLLDEPTASLDAANVARVEATVRSLVARGLRAVWVTHDHAQAERVGDRVLALAAGGRAVADGAPEQGAGA